MAKYKCQCGYGAVIEVKGDEAPECCGKPMKKVDDKLEDNGKDCGCC